MRCGRCRRSDAARGVVTHSSGNHGAALALAARTRGIPCHVVVPENAVAAKLAAIRAYGATLHACAPTIAAREAACAQVQAETGAELVHPYTDPRVIAGQGTAALELLGNGGAFDAIDHPGRRRRSARGTAIAARALAPHVRVFGRRACGRGRCVQRTAARRALPDYAPTPSATACAALLGAPNFELLRRHEVAVLLADDVATLRAMRLFWERTKQLIEPSSAVALAAVLAHRERFAGQRVGVIVSGGNVDLDALASLLANGS